jgi:hypothetical protein
MLTDTINIIGFTNVGLLIGLSKTSLGVREDVIPLNGWFSGAVLGAMYPEKMTNYFLNYHKREIKIQTTFGSRVLNIYAHPFLGGLGFPIPPGITPSYSEHQRALAFHLLQAAQMNYYGPASDHPLKPFAYLSLADSPSISLGSHPGKVYTRLGSLTGPYQEGEVVFADKTTIHASPLAMAYGDLETSLLTPSCRLSNGELHRLLKTANHQRQSLVPAESMHTFPFRVISYDPEKEFQPIPLDTSDTILLPELAEQPEIIDLWEIPTNPHLEALKNFKLRPLQYRIGDEERAVRRSAIRLQKFERRRQMLILNESG